METTKLDPTSVNARLDAIERDLAYLVRQQEKTADLFAEMTPILREVMGTATAKLDELDKRGYFAFGKEVLGLGERVVEGFAPEDVRRLGDALVGILETVRAVTQPKVLEIAGEASAVLENADQTEPIGLLGMVRATRDDDVQKGMAVMMEMMRHVGRAAHVVREQRKADPNLERKAKLAAALGPRRRKALGVERTAAPVAPARTARAERAAEPGAPSAPPTARTVAAVIEGVAFGADGHLADPTVWTTALAQKLAAAQGLELDDARWALVRFARADFEKTATSPNIRRLTQGTNLATKDIYAIFPKAPARTIAKIAGIPKPTGCI
jgi:TusE/DsrC/DsvC family sulfur relay protein